MKVLFRSDRNIAHHNLVLVEKSLCKNEMYDDNISAYDYVIFALPSVLFRLLKKQEFKQKRIDKTFLIYEFSEEELAILMLTYA